MSEEETKTQEKVKPPSIDEIPEGFKMTKLGPLPEDWEVVKGSELFQETKMRVKNMSTEFSGIVLSITRYHGLVPQTKKFSKQIASRDLSNYKVVVQGQLVYGFPINEGVLAISKYKLGAVSPAYYVWNIIRDDLDLTYLDWLVKHPIMISQYVKFSSNVVHRRKNLKPKDFLQCLFPLPPLPEQRRIAFVLSSIQQDIEATEKVIKAAKELKKSMMSHLFTYGPVPPAERDKVKLRESEIGMIPEEWEVVKVGTLFEKSRKPRSLSINPAAEIPFIPMEAISENKKRVSGWKMKKIHEISSGTFVFKNDLLIAKITPSFENGKQAIIDNIPTNFAYATTEVWPFHPKDKTKVITEHLFNYLKMDEIRKSLADKMEGTTGRKRLPKSAVENLLIPLPPLPVQRKIAEILSAIDGKIEAEERKKKALEEVFKSMLHNLMTGRIRVKDLDLGKYEADKKEEAL